MRKDEMPKVKDLNIHLKKLGKNRKLNSKWKKIIKIKIEIDQGENQCRMEKNQKVQIQKHTCSLNTLIKLVSHWGN
jgi:hypothetical protein